MNYIRGAVNAISAPYQYYKELPPINPSTLTGAIDVIVIQRPGSNGDIELACSPFHVRFGKWQVLRPSDKKVNVSINGKLIPYNMKIGEAGEAFFVFETDDDVPPDLITSPILQPTRPEEEASAAEIDAPTGRFGVEAGPDDQSSHEADLSQTQESVHQLPNESVEQGIQHSPQEPEFFDLNAGTNGSPEEEEDGLRDTNLTPKQTFRQPSFIRRSTSQDAIQRQVSTEEPSKSTLGLPSPPPSRSPTPEMERQDKIIDEALKHLVKTNEGPEVQYHEDVALDIEGYHAHAKEVSDKTVRSSGSPERYKFPSLRKQYVKSSTSTPSPPEMQFAIHSARNLSPSDSDSEGNEPSTSHRRRPSLRATSEPPPDLDEPHHHVLTNSEHVFDNSEFTGLRNKSGQGPKLQSLPSSSGIQEYSWDWGAFPTPSPVKTTFGKGGRLEGGIHWKGKARQTNDLFPLSQGQEEQIEDSDASDTFGSGGRLSAKHGDDTIFVLTIDHQTVSFELSLVPQSAGRAGKGTAEELEKEEFRGRKVAGKSEQLLPGAQSEAEAASIFEAGKITFANFMQDESLVANPALVVKWGEMQYVSRQDGSPLLEALASWRENTLREGGEEDGEESRHMRSTSAPPTQEQKEMLGLGESQHGPVTNAKPGSMSWAQWWSRSRRDADGKAVPGARGRPMLASAASAPPSSAASKDLPQPQTALDDEIVRKRAAQEIDNESSTPILPSTSGDEASLADVTPRPSFDQVNSIQQIQNQQQQPTKMKFAKTLRLTSDQLKSLDLKPGANSITFSISSGIIACTARIFVWDYTDHVVISDIDGTITKSDGLGHVFAMIGRDWTHVGVAKLYTDIVRNGYKIMYLTSRAIGQADATRGYLKGIKQNNYQLPEGPVIMSPDRLMASLHREVIMRKPEVFKMACLRDIQRLFSEHSKYPFYAGFGNRITDALSYRSVNVPSARIFTIDSAGEVKMELLELAGYKSSYIHMTDLVDQMFPPIHRKWTPEYTDFNYWKLPERDYPLPDLSPPSPTLSARSDTSNQSALAKLRNFRLMGSRANSISMPSNQNTSNDNAYDINSADLSRDQDLKQMSSFERLVSGLRRSVSPSSVSRSSLAVDSDSESDADGYLGDGRRDRRRSMTSMPGSLDDIHFGMDDDEEDIRWEDEHEDEHGDEYDEEEGYNEEEMDEVDEMDEDTAIDEDLQAATEMKKIPFL